MLFCRLALKGPAKCRFRSTLVPFKTSQIANTVANRRSHGSFGAGDLVERAGLEGQSKAAAMAAFVSVVVLQTVNAAAMAASLCAAVS